MATMDEKAVAAFVEEPCKIIYEKIKELTYIMNSQDLGNLAMSEAVEEITEQISDIYESLKKDKDKIQSFYDVVGSVLASPPGGDDDGEVNQEVLAVESSEDAAASNDNAVTTKSG